jgi:hypothetical protein
VADRLAAPAPQNPSNPNSLDAEPPPLDAAAASDRAARPEPPVPRVDARACDRRFACVAVFVGCFTNAVASALSARRTIACEVAAGAALSTPSTATPPPASAAADAAAAAAIFPAVTVSTIAWARRN